MVFSPWLLGFVFVKNDRDTTKPAKLAAFIRDPAFFAGLTFPIKVQIERRGGRKSHGAVIPWGNKLDISKRANVQTSNLAFHFPLKLAGNRWTLKLTRNINTTRYVHMYLRIYVGLF